LLAAAWPLALGALIGGMGLATGRGRRWRRWAFLAGLSVGGVLLACGPSRPRWTAEERYAKINELTDVVGSVELIVGAELKPSRSLLSPGGRWLRYKRSSHLFP